MAEGDSAVQCLSHKLSLKKRDTVTTVRELTLAYIKRLRALGWHLHAMCGRYWWSCKAMNRSCIIRSTPAQKVQVQDVCAASAGCNQTSQRWITL